MNPDTTDTIGYATARLIVTAEDLALLYRHEIERGGQEQLGLVLTPGGWSTDLVIPHGPTQAALDAAHPLVGTTGGTLWAAAEDDPERPVDSEPPAELDPDLAAGALHDAGDFRVGVSPRYGSKGQ